MTELTLTMLDDPTLALLMKGCIENSDNRLGAWLAGELTSERVRRAKGGPPAPLNLPFLSDAEITMALADIGRTKSTLADASMIVPDEEADGLAGALIFFTAIHDA